MQFVRAIRIVVGPGIMFDGEHTRLLNNEATAAGRTCIGREFARRLRLEAEPAAAGRSLAVFQLVIDAPPLRGKTVSEFEGAVFA